MEDKKSFFSTIPGILTGTAALITAIGGLILTLNKPKDPVIVINDPHSNTIVTPIQKESKIEEKIIDKIKGQWSFELHSDISGNILKGKIIINQSSENRENQINGDMYTSNRTDFNNFSSKITGVLEGNLLKIDRDTGINGIIQSYELTINSQQSMTGNFHNSDNSSTYNDNGSISFSR